MKALSTQTVQELAKCSKSTALEIIYSDILETKKLYLNKKNNSSATMKWLERNFSAFFTYGNDAPRGGKTGDFVTFTFTTSGEEKFNSFVSTINSENAKLLKRQNESKISNQAKVEAMVISETEKQNFLAKTTGMSNKSAKAVAHSYAGRKLGFFSNEGKDKFMDLRK